MELRGTCVVCGAEDVIIEYEDVLLSDGRHVKRFFPRSTDPCPWHRER